ncbi:hypothetical protein V5O48_003778 [Marasmius crinis-equi]|uniref:Uncharacterized protein n=1 Tax=Marasmius crinis-equi TaxID=585013 RepID=A0ABR3FRW1_9AGAR
MQDSDFILSGISLPPEIQMLSGTVPGLLDPSQKRRILRHPSSQIFFASFDPRTAAPDYQTSIFDTDIHRRRRIVLEVICNHTLTWRFVPSASLDQAATNEGAWPRLVEICGKLYYCSEEQWDIYKLDHRYICYVRPPPLLSTITIDPGHANSPSQYETGEQASSFRRSSQASNPMSVDVSPEYEGQISASRRSSQASNQMSIDISLDGFDSFQRRDHCSRDEKKRKLDKLMSTPTTQRREPPDNKLKSSDRILKLYYQSTDSSDSKRLRLMSPAQIQYRLSRLRASRNKRREVRRAALARQRRVHRDSWLFQQGLASARHHFEHLSRQRDEQDPVGVKTDSIRTPSPPAKSLDPEPKENQREYREGYARKKREACLEQIQSHRDVTSWPFSKVLKFYEKYGEVFDRTRFRLEEPLVWEAVPWPVSHPPPVEDRFVDWGHVESFFEQARAVISPAEFQIMVDKSLLRFHLDKWRAKGSLETVVSEDERWRLEHAANTVTQILTTLRQRLKRR